MNQEPYLYELKQRLSFRGASRRRANDIVAEVRSHLADSGEDPVEAFGTPDVYAERVLRGYRWPTARFLALMLLGVGGGSLVGLSLAGLTGGESVVSVDNGVLILWLVIALVAPAIQLPVVVRRIPRVEMRLLIMVPGACAATVVASYVADHLPDDRTLVSSRPEIMLVAGIGLIAAAALLAAVSYLRRRA